MTRRNPIELTVRPKQVIPFERRPNAENLRANFLARFNSHFLSKPDGELFEQIYRENPALYFTSLVQLAKVLKVEVGEAGAFDNKPRPREEALRKLEERAGTDARKLFEAFLKKIDKLEAAALEPRKARNDTKKHTDGVHCEQNPRPARGMGVRQLIQRQEQARLPIEREGVGVRTCAALPGGRSSGRTRLGGYCLRGGKATAAGVVEAPAEPVSSS
jgi:hypothetical protein